MDAEPPGDDDGNTLVNVLIRLCVVEMGCDEVTKRVDIVVCVVCTVVFVEIAPRVLVDVPTPSEVGRVDGIGIDDVADARGLLKEPVMPVNLNRSVN